MFIPSSLLKQGPSILLSQRAAGAATFAATVQESAGARIDLYYDLPDRLYGGLARRAAVKSRFAGAGPYLSYL